jgi:hypothetical protein
MTLVPRPRALCMTLVPHRRLAVESRIKGNDPAHRGIIVQWDSVLYYFGKTPTFSAVHLSVERQGHPLVETPGLAILERGG